MFGRFFGRNKEENKEKIDQGLARTKSTVFDRIKELFVESDVTPELYDDLEALLIQGDVGMAVTGPGVMDAVLWTARRHRLPGGFFRIRHVLHAPGAARQALQDEQDQKKLFHDQPPKSVECCSGVTEWRRPSGSS